MRHYDANEHKDAIDRARSLFDYEPGQWISTRAFFDGDDVADAKILARKSNAFMNRQLGATWTLHVRDAEQMDGELPRASIRLTDAERRTLILQLGGTFVEDDGVTVRHREEVL